MFLIHQYTLCNINSVLWWWCKINQVSIGSNNSLSLIRRQAIIWSNAGLLSIGPLWIKLSEILIKIQNFSLTKMHLKILFTKWRSFCYQFWGDDTKWHWIILSAAILTNAFGWSVKLYSPLVPISAAVYQIYSEGARLREATVIQICRLNL